MFAGRFSSSIGVLGIDFAARGIRLLQLREHQRTLHVVGAVRIDTPVTDLRTCDAKTLTEQLRAGFTDGGFTGRRCVITLPRTEVRLQSVRLPRMPEHELRQAAIWEASQRFGFDREAMEADYIRTGATLQGGENREEVLLVAVPHAVLHAVLGPVMAAGMRPVGVDTDFSALARVFSRHARRESDRNLCRAIVEIGASGSTVMILRGDQIAFCKPIAIGGDAFNRAVAEQIELEPHAAAELRATRIAAVGDETASDTIDRSTDRAVFEAVRPLMGDLVKEVVLCLRYYGVTFRGHPPDRIILTGGDGLEPVLNRMLAEGCKLPVEYDDPLATLDQLRNGIQMKLARSCGPVASWAVAAGLSLRGLNAARRADKDQTEQEARRGAA